MMNYNFKSLISITQERNAPGPYPDVIEEVEITKAWADIKTMKGKDYAENIIANTVETSRFIIRYIPDVDVSMKVNFKGQKYNITSIVNDNEQNKTLTIYCEALVKP